MHKAVDGATPIALIIGQAKVLFQVPDSQFDGETGGIDFKDLGAGQRHICADQDEGFLNPGDDHPFDRLQHVA